MTSHMQQVFAPEPHSMMIKTPYYASEAQLDAEVVKRRLGNNCKPRVSLKMTRMGNEIKRQVCKDGQVCK